MKARRIPRAYRHSKQNLESSEEKSVLKRSSISISELVKSDEEKPFPKTIKQHYDENDATHKDVTYFQKGERTKAIANKQKVKAKLDTINGSNVSKKKRAQHKSLTSNDGYVGVTGGVTTKKKVVVKKNTRSRRVAFIRHPWNEEGDKAISELVKKYGTTRWSLVANMLDEVYKIQGRTGKQCRER